MSRIDTRGLVVADDILLGVFAYFPGSAREFNHTREQVFDFFYKRQEKYSFLQVLFEGRDGQEGRLIAQAYSTLGVCGLVGSWCSSGNAEMENYLIHSSCQRLFEQSVQRRFRKRALDSLRTLAREFYEAFGRRS